MSKTRDSGIAATPSLKGGDWDEALARYLKEVEELNKEQARSHRFGMLLQELLGFEPEFIETYSAGIESSLKVKGKDRILRGEADNLFGNTIIEFEGNIPKKLDEAEDQLRRYTAILWSQEPVGSRNAYLCIATDGVRFVTYTPKISDPSEVHVEKQDVELIAVEETDWWKLSGHEVFYWLDRHFLRSEVLYPTSEAIVQDFGAKSHAFQTVSNNIRALWLHVKEASQFAVVYESWDRYLLIVYGAKVTGDELFVKHTYLATLAKVMAWMRITNSTTLPDNAQIIEMLNGQLFKNQGIDNFIEEDFFSWLARGEAQTLGASVVRWLFSLLQKFRLHELSEDVLKSLYQELVDPQTRHDLGEFYTPDWLAQRIVSRCLEINPHGSMLDPSCGSGTFLYMAIRAKRHQLKDSPQTLQHILESVCGADVHPLAVIVARTNYILAMGELLHERQGQITIPIYLADMLKLPELVIQSKLTVVGGGLVFQLPGYKIYLETKEVNLPEILVSDIPVYDHAVELAKDFARENKGKKASLEQFQAYLGAQGFALKDDDQIVAALFAITYTIRQFIEKGRDTIWAYVLKNGSAQESDRSPVFVGFR